MKLIRILIADDHPVFRFGLHALLNAMPDTEVDSRHAAGANAIQYPVGAKGVASQIVHRTAPRYVLTRCIISV
jgi:DNA-binding NarL/FixJ family response regulator